MIPHTMTENDKAKLHLLAQTLVNNSAHNVLAALAVSKDFENATTHELAVQFWHAMISCLQFKQEDYAETIRKARQIKDLWTMAKNQQESDVPTLTENQL